MCRCWFSVAIWEKKLAGISAMSRPSRSFTWDIAITIAMPLVNPMTIGTGTNRTSWPRRNAPIAIRITPASIVAISRFAMP